MEIYERSRHISRIISGEYRIKIGDMIFYIRRPSRRDIYLAEEIYIEQLEEAGFAGALSDDQLLDLLLIKGIWTENDDEALKVLTEDIDKLKVGLFQLRFKSHQRNVTRKALELAKKEFTRLQILKHSYDHMTCKGIASSTKERYLLGCSTFNKDGSPYWENGEIGWLLSDPFLDKIMLKLNTVRLGEIEFRELSRTDPWRTNWNLQEYCKGSIFDGSVLDLTEDQKNLIFWSAIYDGARKNNVPEDVIEDDDTFDGWSILQRKEREKNNGLLNPDDMIKNTKIKESSEIFHPVDTVQDAQKIINMNDEEGSYKLNQRMKVIHEAGTAGIPEQKLPDVSKKLQQQKMDRFSEHINSMKPTRKTNGY